MSKKFLVSVPITARMEITVEAETEEEAMEKAYLEACSEDVKLINHETIEPIFYADKIETIEADMLEFAVSDGYWIWDYEKEFGDMI